ncbi:MAG: response regulator [Rhodospirillales bacterium]|nr:response regulator [Rhodospirillales bacterium]
MKEEKYREFRVLVVEDHPFTRQIVKGVLRNLGFGHIAEAGDGEMALANLQMSPPDLIVCDIHMEPMGGLALLSAIRASSSARLRRIPFVFLTSLNDEATIRGAIREGVDGYVLKPVTPSVLESRIDAALRAAVEKS